MGAQVYGTQHARKRTRRILGGVGEVTDHDVGIDSAMERYLAVMSGSHADAAAAAAAAWTDDGEARRRRRWGRGRRDL